MMWRRLLPLLVLAFTAGLAYARNPPFLSNESIQEKIQTAMATRKTPAAAVDIIASFHLLVRIFKGELAIGDSEGLRTIAGPGTLDLTAGTRLREGRLVLRTELPEATAGALSVLSNSAPTTGIATVDAALQEQLLLSRQIAYQAAMHALMRDALAAAAVPEGLPLTWWNNLARPEWRDELFLPLNQAALFPIITHFYEDRLLDALSRSTEDWLKTKPLGDGEWALDLLKQGTPEEEPWAAIWKSYQAEDQQRQAWREFYKAQERSVLRWADRYLARIISGNVANTRALRRFFTVHGLRDKNHPDIVFRQFLRSTISVSEIVNWLDYELHDTAFLRYAGAIGDPQANPHDYGTRENIPQFPSEFRFQRFFLNAWRMAVHNRKFPGKTDSETFLAQFLNEILQPSKRRFLNFKLATLIHQLHNAIQRDLFSSLELQALQKPLHALVIQISSKATADSVGHYPWAADIAGQFAYLIDKAIQIGRGWNKMEAKHVEAMIAILADESADPFERSAAFATLSRRIPAMTQTFMDTAELIHTNGIQLPADFLAAIRECALGIVKARDATPEIRFAD